jgi:hypothetical protein
MPTIFISFIAATVLLLSLTCLVTALHIRSDKDLILTVILGITAIALAFFGLFSL